MPSKITFIWDNPVDANTLWAQTEALPVTNLKTKLRTQKWRTTGCVNEGLYIAFDKMRPVNVLVLVDDNLSYGAQINAVFSNDGVNWTSGLLFNVWESSFGAGEGGAGEEGAGGYYNFIANRAKPARIIFLDALIGSPAEYRYVWLFFMDPANPAGYIEMGRLYLANYYESDRNYVKGAGMEIVDQSEVQYSEGGQPWTNEKTIFNQYDLSINNISREQRYNRFIRMYYQVGKRKDFILALSPGDSRGRYQYSHYGRFTAEMGGPQAQYDLFDLKIKFRESL